MNFYISVVLMSSRDVFLDFQRLSRKLKKKEVLDDRGHANNDNFC